MTLKKLYDSTLRLMKKDISPGVEANVFATILGSLYKYTEFANHAK